MGTRHRIGSVKLCGFCGTEVNEKTTRPRTIVPGTLEPEILTIAGHVITFGHFATSHANNPTWSPCCLLLRRNATNPPKFWNTSSTSTRIFEKYPSSAISTFMSDPDLNLQDGQRSSGWALPTMATLSRSNLYILPQSAPFGLLLRFLKPGVPGCDSGMYVHRTSSLVIG